MPGRLSFYLGEFERSRTTGHRLRTRRDSGSWYAAARPRLRRLLVRVANDWRHRTLLLYRYTHYRWYPCGGFVCPLLRSFFVLLYACRIHTDTGEGHRCARPGAYLGLCLPNVNGRLGRARGKRKRGKEKKRKEKKKKRSTPKRSSNRRRPLSPYRGAVARFSGCFSLLLESGLGTSTC